MKRYGLCRRCWETPLVSGMWAYVVQRPVVIIKADVRVIRRQEEVLWCETCGLKP